MFFLAFAGSIRIFTLFLNLLNSEFFLIPATILLAIVSTFFQHKVSSWANAKDPENFPLLIGEGKGEVHNKTPMDSSAKASEWREQKQRIKLFRKNLLRWIIANILAIVVISWHLYHKKPEYFQQFIGIKNIEYTTPERKIFNEVWRQREPPPAGLLWRGRRAGSSCFCGIRAIWAEMRYSPKNFGITISTMINGFSWNE